MKKDMRLQEASSQIKLTKELADFASHPMCKAAQLRARLNGTEGEDGYQLWKTSTTKLTG